MIFIPSSRPINWVGQIEMDELTWNVYYDDVNSRKINTWNIFQHYSFKQDIEGLLKKVPTYNQFADELKHIVRYYFRSKAEYEVVITSWVPHIGNKELDRLIAERENHQCRLYYVNLDIGEKIDIYDQLMLNWNMFARYVYSFVKSKARG